ncbi:uncharacterized protein A4U43_C06F19150 [Asparagus officinalis]|uniref:Uncharacterized protein n=1 Tax=Asparagus officinalis TaxID=4686 RepID=A0A5P1ETF4_ASPOF|nr:uncharacterized protein A4U43_C06F19150 [Asparagus officinalis]
MERTRSPCPVKRGCTRRMLAVAANEERRVDRRPFPTQGLDTALAMRPTTRTSGDQAAVAPSGFCVPRRHRAVGPASRFKNSRHKRSASCSGGARRPRALAIAVRMPATRRGVWVERRGIHFPVAGGEEGGEGSRSSSDGYEWQLPL